MSNHNSILVRLCDCRLIGCYNTNYEIPPANLFSIAHHFYFLYSVPFFFLFCYESVWFRILFELHTNHLNDLLANTGEMVVRPLVPIPFLQASKSLDVYACVCNNNCLNLYRKCNLVARFGKFAQSSRINN